MHIRSHLDILYILTFQLCQSILNIMSYFVYAFEEFGGFLYTQREQLLPFYETFSRDLYVLIQEMYKTDILLLLNKINYHFGDCVYCVAVYRGRFGIESSKKKKKMYSILLIHI